MLGSLSTDRLRHIDNASNLRPNSTTYLELKSGNQKTDKLLQHDTFSKCTVQSKWKERKIGVENKLYFLFVSLSNKQLREPQIYKISRLPQSPIPRINLDPSCQPKHMFQPAMSWNYPAKWRHTVQTEYNCKFENKLNCLTKFMPKPYKLERSLTNQCGLILLERS